MYNLVTSLLIAKVKPKGFEEIKGTALRNMTIDTLFNDYIEGYLVVTNNHLAGEKFLDIRTLRDTNLGILSFGTRLHQLFTALGDRLLPHLDDEPEYDFNKINYADAYQGGFNKVVVHPTSTLEGYSTSDLTDLYMYKGSVDGDIVSNNVIAVINGYLHNHGRYKLGIKVRDGGKTIMNSKVNQAGLLSFSDVGGVRTIEVTPEITKRTKDDISLYQECYIDLSTDLTDKTVMFSIAGTLVSSQDVIQVINPKSGGVIINLSRISFIDRVQHAIKTLGSDELEVNLGTGRIQSLDLEYVTSDAFVNLVLRMSQTFAIIVDQPIVTIKKEPLTYLGVYGKYSSYKYEYDPIVDELGRIVPFFHGGVSSYPTLHDKHLILTPYEFVERSFNIRDTTGWRHGESSYFETTPYVSRANNIEWLTMTFIKSA